jgi:hypothetical protein
MMAMKMSRFSRDRVNRIVEAFDRREKVEPAIARLSWGELRLLIKIMDERDKEGSPWLLTTLVNVETDADLKLLRDEIPMEEKAERDEDILRLRDELRAVWGKPQHEVEATVATWFKKVPIDPEQERWLILHELGVIRPVNLAGTLARAMFQWHEYCFSCANPACNGKRFVASRKDQKYCLLTEECAKYGHRAASRRHYQKQAKADARKARKSQPR